MSTDPLACTICGAPLALVCESTDTVCGDCIGDEAHVSGVPELTLTQRAWDALARIRVSRDLAGQPADTRWRLLIDAWDECVKRWGPDSGPAKGALLDLVREAWDDDEATATPDGDRLRWRVRVADDDGRSDVDPHVLQGATELAALVASLEATPGVEP